MSYLVLARKYRPQTFAEIVGQEHVTRTLANAFAKGRVHHAFLFCGARGVGKTTAARVLAKALCCQNGPTATPCGVCDPCRTIASGTAVDYFEIDGASNNGVDDIRELRDGVRYQPAQLRRKIYVIDEVHMLSVAAFNALLKTLEEPPPHVTFIFATTEVHKIPVTIVSRCQRYDFKLVPTARLLAHLEVILSAEGVAVDPGALRLVAREAGGSVRDALSLLDQVIAYAGGERITESMVSDVLGVADRALLHELLAAVLRHDPRAALEQVDAALARGVDLSHLARTFLGALRDAAVVQAVADPEGLVEATADEIRAVAELVKPVPRPHLLAIFDRFAKACEDLTKQQAPRLLIEVALVDMCGSEPLLPVAELVERLTDLEKRLRPGPSVRPAPAPVPPAAPVPAPRRTSDSISDSMSEWERVVAAVEKTSPTLAGVLAQASLLFWDDRTVELGFPPGSVGADIAADRDKLATLKKALHDLAGTPVDVKIKTVAAAPAARSVADVENDRRQAVRDKREQEARAHPITEAVIETFGATIKEIKVDG